MLRLAALALLLLTAPAAASEAVLARLAEPHTHAIMRHALAPGYSDPAAFDLDDCATQRNLDDRGRAQARRAGALIRAAGVVVDAVWTSQWCRCRDTATGLDLGPVTEVPALNSFFETREDGPAQTRALTALLADLPAATTLVIVTHQVNISALLGRSTASGEILVFRAAPGEAPRILGSVTPPLQ